MECTLPVYVKHSALGANRHDSHMSFKICMAVDVVVPGQIRGAQQIMGLWKIFVKSNEARSALLQHGIEFKGRQIKFHRADPFIAEGIPSEKVIFKDIPLNYSDDMLMQFLQSHPNLTLRSEIISNKILNEYNEETEYLSGDRHVYVQTDFSPVLPQEILIGDSKCRIWHYTQPLVCKRCGADDHRAYDTEKCMAYIPKPDDIKIFWRNNDPLSNFYMCKIRIYGKTFHSSEQAYQWAKLLFLGENSMAEEVLRCRTAKQAKQIANRIPQRDLEGWNTQKRQIMEEILIAKLNCCYQFKKALTDSGTLILVEGTMDQYWGIGQSAYYTETTHPEYLPGRNILGNILMDIRARELSEYSNQYYHQPQNMSRPTECLNHPPPAAPAKAPAQLPVQDGVSDFIHVNNHSTPESINNKSEQHAAAISPVHDFLPDFIHVNNHSTTETTIDKTATVPSTPAGDVTDTSSPPNVTNDNESIACDSDPSSINNMDVGTPPTSI